MITHLTVRNFTLFQQTEFAFGDKLNIIIGENGNGKTQILKLLYALAKSAYSPKSEQMSVQTTTLALNLEKVFHAGLTELQSEGHGGEEFACRMEYEVEQGEKSAIEFAHQEQFRFSEGAVLSLKPEYKVFPISHKPVYLPARELLTIYPNFLSLAELYDLPYDETYTDTIKLLGLPYLNAVPAEFQAIVSLLERHLGGVFCLDPVGGRFYMKFADGHSTRIDMTAEGWRKLGTLMQLLRVGALEAGSVLFWDEPEANLNPRLIRLICDIIVTLGEIGIQVFLTTHSLFLVNELEILVARRKISDGVRYFNFLPKGKVEQGDSFTALKDIVILDETMKQADYYLSAEV